MVKYGEYEVSFDNGQNEFSDIIKFRFDEYNDVQKKIFIKWINV